MVLFKKPWNGGAKFGIKDCCIQQTFAEFKIMLIVFINLQTLHDKNCTRVTLIKIITNRNLNKSMWSIAINQKTCFKNFYMRIPLYESIFLFLNSVYSFHQLFSLNTCIVVHTFMSKRNFQRECCFIQTDVAWKWPRQTKFL